MVSLRPWSKETTGSQPSSWRALVMSGRRRGGSSCGSSSKRMRLEEPVSAMTRRAQSSTVFSAGLPRLTGSASSMRDKRMMPSIRSVT